MHWDHGWVKGTEFDKVRHLILYDYAIHWFDIVACFMGRREAKQVYATVARSPAQEAQPPLLAQVMIEYEGGQASLVFDGDTRFGKQDRTFIAGTGGTILSVGPDSRHQKVTLHTAAGQVAPDLEGCWFPDGFHGAMGELLRAIEDDREPTNGARGNLRSLELCFAAVASAETRQPVVPGTVRRLPGD